MRLRDISIKRKLTLMIMAASLVALLLVSGGFVVVELVTYRQTMTHDLSTLAAIIGNRSTAALSFDDKTDAEETLEALSARKHITAAALYKDGRLFAEYPRTRAENGGVPNSPGSEGVRFEKDRLILFHPVTFKGEPLGVVYLQSDLQEMHQRFSRYGTIVVLILLASILVTFVLSSWLQRIISRPIFHLASVAKAVSGQKNYAIRAAKEGNDELGQLIDGFNQMLGQIQERDQKLEKRVQERTRDLQAEVFERQMAEARLQEQLARISLINRITQVIAERQDTESILHVVLRQLEDHLHLDQGSVALFDAAAETFSLAAMRVKNPLLINKLDLHEGLVLQLKETGLTLCVEGQTVYFQNTVKEPSPLAERFARAGLRSLAAVPLLVEGNLFGVLLAARLQADGFSSGDCEFLRTLSEHLALAAHQARLHRKLEHAYQDLRQTQQAVMQQERLKALGQMASGIAHDVNNALSPVVGFADLLLTTETGLTERGLKHVRNIRTAGEDIAHIVARLREFYRRREEEEPLQELDLSALAEQVIDMTRPRWRDIPQSRGITLEMNTQLETGLPRLVGIESEVREALTNLVLNAVDALPKGGTITLRTCLSSHETKDGPDPSHLILEVSDTGVGMSEETRKRCLEPFFSTKGKRGTGLGLAMVYGVMERHEGSIDIQSEPGEGSTFRLIFPVRRDNRATGQAEDHGPASQPLRVLCIDDEPLLRDLLKEMLERDGHTVEVADGGQSGIDAFRTAARRQEPFEIVITDLGMPYIDGRQVARVIKHESANTPVIMLTGWGVFIKEEGSPPAQVDSVLSKPPRIRELRKTFAQLAPKRTAALPSPRDALAA